MKKIIYQDGIPYRNWYHILPVMDDEAENETERKVHAIRKSMGLTPEKIRAIHASKRK